MSAELLRRAADVIETNARDAVHDLGPWTYQRDAVGLPIVASEEDSLPIFGVLHGTHWDAVWAAAVGPQIAAPLVAWLRAAADAADSYPNTDGVHGRIMRSDGQPAAYRHTVEFVERASAVARAVLGEEVS